MSQLVRLPAESTVTSSAGSRVIQQVPRTVSSIPSHGQRILRCQPTIPAGDSPECGTTRGTSVSPPECRRTGPPQDRLRQGEEGPDIPEGRTGGPSASLYGIVHIDLQELHKGASPKVHPLCQPVHRSTRTATGRREDSRDSAQESTQESSTDHDVSSRMAGSNTQFVTFAKSEEQPLGDDPRGGSVRSRERSTRLRNSWSLSPTISTRPTSRYAH